MRYKYEKRGNTVIRNDPRSCKLWLWLMGRVSVHGNGLRKYIIRCTEKIILIYLFCFKSHFNTTMLIASPKSLPQTS